MIKKRVARIAAAVCCALVAMLMITACSGKQHGDQTPDAGKRNTFLDGTTVNGLNVSGLTPEEAAAALTERVQGYSCTIRLGETCCTFSGDDLSLTCLEDAGFQSLLDSQKEDASLLDFTVDGLISADMTVLRTRLEADFQEPESALPADEEAEAENGEPKNAYLKYDADTMTYEIVPDEPVIDPDIDAVIQLVRDAVLRLETEIVVDMEPYTRRAEITADNEKLLAALEEINSGLALQLTYTFTPTGDKTSSETISGETMTALFRLDETGLSVDVDKEALGVYVDSLVSRYSVSGRTVQFKTTGGSFLDLTVSVGSQRVDSDGLYQDLLQCLLGKTGGTRNAPYERAEGDGYWGGNYVEVDLTGQQLWLYRNGECILSCPIVSGCVANETETPTGCYTIYSMEKDRYLSGYNADGTRYREWVSYFMPFIGGYAIHDATWRSEFGGTEYYYNGSHGCVGVTVDDAKIIYENVGTGTHVVLYGGIGVSDLPTQDPGIRFAQSEYTVEVGQTIDLGLTVVSDGTYRLTAENENAAVLEDGTICGVAAGDVTIHCSVEGTGSYKPGSAEVLVHVVAADSHEEEASNAAD